MTLNQKAIKKIKGLRKRGYSYKEIAKESKISSATSYKYSYPIILSKKVKKRLDLKIKNNQLKFKRIYSRPKKIDIKHKKLTIEKVRILSHCLWDGSISNGTIRYNNTSKSLVAEFKIDMLKVYGILPDKDYYRIRNRRQILYTVDYYTKKVCNDLLKYSPSFSTKSNKSIIPKQVLASKNKDILKEFLRILWEDEGSISYYGAIRIKIKGKHIRDQLIRLHKKFGIDLTAYKEKGDYYGIYIKNHLQNLKRFSEICFRKSCVVSGKNKGKLKYEIFNSLFDKKCRHYKPI